MNEGIAFFVFLLIYQRHMIWWKNIISISIIDESMINFWWFHGGQVIVMCFVVFLDAENIEFAR